MVANFEVGQQVEIGLLRSKKRQTLMVNIGKLEDEEKQKEKTKASQDRKKDKLGFVVGPVTDAERKALNLSVDVQGLVIRSMDPTAPAARRGVKVGDFIVELNQQKIADIATYDKILKAMNKGDAVMLKVLKESGGRWFSIFTLE